MHLCLVHFISTIVTAYGMVWKVRTYDLSYKVTHDLVASRHRRGTGSREFRGHGRTLHARSSRGAQPAGAAVILKIGPKKRARD